MPSRLRIASSVDEPFDAPAVHNITTIAQRPTKRARMSLSTVYSTASLARQKLGREAARSEHQLRLLVGHANLLDQLMVELADAERESENWLNQSIREASRPEEPRRVQWLDSIAEDYEEDEEEEDSDAESEYDDEEMELHSEIFSIKPKIKFAPVVLGSDEVAHDEHDDADYDSDEADEGLSLRRVPSQQSPPELSLDDSDSESEEEDYAPRSPTDPVHLELSEKEREALTTTAYFDLKSQSAIDEYVIQSSQQQPLIAAC